MTKSGILAIGRYHIPFGGFLIGVTSLLVRLAFVKWYPVTSLAGGDPRAYWGFALSLSQGKGYVPGVPGGLPWLADRPPFYPFFLSWVIRIFGTSHTAAYVVQAFLGALAAVGFFAVAMRLLGVARGYLAGFLFALWPHFLLFTKQILTEALYTPLIVSLISLLVLPSQLRRKHWLLSGLLIGILGLTRREAMLPAGLITLAFVWLRGSHCFRGKIKNVLLMGCGVAIVLLPWVARNYQVLGKPVLYSTTGINFLVGNNPNATGAYTELPTDYKAQLSGLSELEYNRKAWALAWDWIRSNPTAALALISRKFLALTSPFHNVVLDLADLVALVLVFLAWVKLIRHTRAGSLNNTEKWLLASFLPLVISILMVGIAFVGGPRYRFGIYPAWLLLAVYGVPQVCVRILCEPINEVILAFNLEGTSP